MALDSENTLRESMQIVFPSRRASFPCTRGSEIALGCSSGLLLGTRGTTLTTLGPGTSSPSTVTVEWERSAAVLAPPGAVAQGGPRHQRRAEVYPCLLPPPAFHFGVVSSRHKTGGASLGDPLRSRRRRRAQRTRPQLPACCPAGPRGEGGSRGWHQAVRGWHRGQEPLSDLAADP